MPSVSWPKFEPRLAGVVENRFFAGFTETEIAETLGSCRTHVRRDWERARVLLPLSEQ